MLHVKDPKYCATMVHVEHDRRHVGRLGEDVAAQFLERKGYKLLERNYLRSWGEIDIIAEKGGTVCFVEVKALSFDVLPDISRENNNYRPEEQVHPAKLHKVARTAEMYMNEKGDSREYRIDVVGVFLDEKRKKARCRLLEGVL